MGDEASFIEEFRAARAGDRGAQERLFTRMLRIALDRVRRRMGAADRAMLESVDVRQSVLLRLYGRLGEMDFTAEEQLAAWLDAAAENVLREKRRGAHRLRRDVRRNQAFPTGGLPDPAAVSLRRILRRLQVEQALSRLPPDAAEVVRLRAMEERGFGEISTRLGLSGPEAARKRYARALARLAILFRQEDGV